jgi:sulfite exporter TauE/SafE
MDLSLATPMAAFITGLVTSVHCSAMCGPIVCALRANPLEYHASRFVSYTVAGALCGTAGQTVAAFLQGSAARIVPWAFVIVLILMGFGLEKRLPQPRFVTSLLLRMRFNRSLGWLTPLFPCGPLWLMFGAAVLTGSWLSGAIHMASFAVGTIPLPLFIQANAVLLQRKFSPPALHRIQQVLAFVSAGLLVWRNLLPLHASCH